MRTRATTTRAVFDPKPERVALYVPALPDTVWSVDFMSDALACGRRLRTFNVVDHFNRQALHIEVDTSINSHRLVRFFNKSSATPACRRSCARTMGRSSSAGYLDTAGFLALQGLFTVHVTGNFVTIGSALINGTSGILTKLAALPMFCLAVILVRWSSYRLSHSGEGQLRGLLMIKLALLVAAALLAVHFGPFDSADTWPGFFTGMALVSAMAIQNGLHRIYLGKAPPTTMMTGTSTQIMLDVGDLIHGVPAEHRGDLLARMRAMALNALLFAAGCALAAFAYHLLSMWCFALPPLFTAVVLWIRRASSET